MVKKCRMNWFGHVSRRDLNTGYVKKSYKQDFTTKRRPPKKRPPKRWSDMIRDDTGLPLLTAERKAQDREIWKKFVTLKYARIQTD